MDDIKDIKTKKRQLKTAQFVYTLLCNIPVCFFLCLTSALCAATSFEGSKMIVDFNINWISMALNFVIALVLAICIGMFIPLTDIGRWFTGLFKVEHVTYAGNIKYRLLATLIISIIYYLIISPSLMLFNYFVFKNMTINQCLLNLLFQAPIMLLVGFVSSLINDLFAYKVAHRIDSDF